ncbi:hypothetical protein JXA85_08530 [Candidatus Woesearchaeota archaeon]|nr:hypothetical protein [Candidatus Woesearchaeota archaeon]
MEVKTMGVEDLHTKIQKLHEQQPPDYKGIASLVEQNRNVLVREDIDPVENINEAIKHILEPNHTPYIIKKNEKVAEYIETTYKLIELELTIKKYALKGDEQEEKQKLETIGKISLLCFVAALNNNGLRQYTGELVSKYEEKNH